jgi:long-chain acyl-CoA synthetase
MPQEKVQLYLPSATFGEYKWKSFQNIKDEGVSLASSLLNKNLCPEVTDDGRTFKFIGIYAKNCEEFMVVDAACVLTSLTSVCFYDTLGKDSLEYIIDHTTLTTMSMTADKIKNMSELKSEGKIPSLMNLILFNEPTSEEKQQAEDAGFTVYQYTELMAEGYNNQAELIPPTPETIYTFCYTSGTTGVPKGAMISHKNILADVSSIAAVASPTPEDVHISYLPL